MYVTELTAQRDSIRSFSGHDYDIYNTKEDICKSEYKNCHITIFFKEPGKCNETIYRTNNTIYTSEFPFLKTILALIIDRYDKPSEEIFSYFKKNKNLAAIINNEDFDKKSFLDGIVYLAQHFEKYIEEKISLNKPFAISNPLFRDFLAYLDPIANENIPEEISKILANYLYKKFLTKNSASEENDIYSMFKDLLAYNEKTEYNPQEGPFYLIYFLGLCKNKIIKPAKNRFFSEEYKRAIFDSQGLLEYCPDLDDKEKEEAANRAIGQNIRRQQNQINIQNQNNFNIYHSILYSQSIVTRYYFR